VVLGVAVLALAGGAFAGATVTATPSIPSNQYSGCVEGGLLFGVTIGTLPHGCPRFSTEITWNQTGPQGPSGSSNTTLYTWTATIPAQGSGAGGYAQVTASTVIPVGSTIVPISGTVITGDLSDCAMTGFGLDLITVSAPGPDARAGDAELAGTSGYAMDHSGTALSIDGSKFVSVAGPLVASVYCNGSSFESGPGGPTPPVTLTLTFAVTTPPPGPAQTYT